MEDGVGASSSRRKEKWRVRRRRKRRPVATLVVVTGFKDVRPLRRTAKSGGNIWNICSQNGTTITITRKPRLNDNDDHIKEEEEEEEEEEERGRRRF